MIRVVCAVCMKAFDGEDERQARALFDAHACRKVEFVGGAA